jgi:hypothetical protein
MKLSKFDIKRLENIAKALNDREAEIRSKYDVVQGCAMVGDSMRTRWCIVSKKTRILCLDYFASEDAAWTWLFNV